MKKHLLKIRLKKDFDNVIKIKCFEIILKIS